MDSTFMIHYMIADVVQIAEMWISLSGAHCLESDQMIKYRHMSYPSIHSATKFPRMYTRKNACDACYQGPMVSYLLRCIYLYFSERS